MRYTVNWHAQAQDDLAQIWLSALERGAVSFAADQIDRSLRIDPNTRGVEHLGDRILIINPLAVTFSVDAENRVVRVIRIWRDSTSNRVLASERNYNERFPASPYPRNVIKERLTCDLEYTS